MGRFAYNSYSINIDLSIYIIVLQPFPFNRSCSGANNIIITYANLSIIELQGVVRVGGKPFLVVEVIILKKSAFS